MRQPPPLTNPPNRNSHDASTVLQPMALSRAKGARCQMVLAAGTAPHFTDELTDLLRRRLRLATVIILVGTIIFMVWSWILPSVGTLERVADFLHTVVAAILTALAAVLWSRLRLTLCGLRRLELVLFGVLAAFFAYLQVIPFLDHQLMSWAPELFRGDTLALVIIASTVRWVILIVLYGTFIPNTWKRSAAVVGLLALLPVVLTAVVCGQCEIQGPHLGPGLIYMIVALGVAAAIAIFGTYRISELHQQAFSARKLGQYQLLRRLGSGGMGEVYLGEHMFLRRQCAIKVIRPDQAGDPTAFSRFEREVQAMATLTHWNTVEVYDYGRADDGTFYYAMEYLPGLSLQELVEQYGPLPPGRAVYFLRQVCDALREAHGIGLIHRDIKPSNIIACQRGGVYDVAKLLDFGLVHSFAMNQDGSKLTMQGTILGSPGFMAPEQALGKTDIDARTDIYALGGVLYFLLTGHPPFERETPMELLVSHVHEAVVPVRQLRPELPPDLEEVVARCLAKDPAQRFADAAALDRALAECVSAGQWDRDQAAAWWHRKDQLRAAMVPV